MKVYVVNMYIFVDVMIFRVAQAAFSKKEEAISYMEEQYGMTQKSNKGWWIQGTEFPSKLEAHLLAVDIDEFFEKYFNTSCVAEEW